MIEESEYGAVMKTNCQSRNNESAQNCILCYEEDD